MGCSCMNAVLHIVQVRVTVCQLSNEAVSASIMYIAVVIFFSTCYVLFIIIIFNKYSTSNFAVRFV